MNKRKIFVADDDENILYLITLTLKIAGFEVITSNDGMSLFSTMTLPSVIFLDLAMENTNGGEICKEYKKNPATSHIPIILVSADPHLPRIAQACGANDILPKPFDLSKLLDMASKYSTDTVN